MLIKDRLSISNNFQFILIILISIFVLRTADSIFQDYYSKDLYISEKSHIVLDLIKDYKVSITDHTSALEQTNDQLQLQNMILKNGYHLIILADNISLSSNFDPTDYNNLTFLQENNFFPNTSFILGTENYKIIKETFYHEGHMIHIIAINSKGLTEINSKQLQLNTIFRSCIGIIIICIFMGILMINALWARKIAKSITTPLYLLQAGASRIKNGDMDSPLKYNGNDEFKSVYENFNAMREELKYYRQQQKKYEEDRKILVAGISHDLKTPITIIKGYVSGLLDGIATNQEKKLHYLHTIHDQASHMDILIDKFFLFSKLDTGLFPFQFVQIDFVHYIKNFYDKTKRQHTAPDIAFTFINKCASPLWTNLDSKEMDRVLINIIENSIKYRSSAMLSIGFLLSSHAGTISLSIFDNGPGVSEENLQHLFKTFYRGDVSRTSPHKGSGLGLSTAYLIILAHQGSIEASNNNGLKITIQLPLLCKNNNEKMI